MSTPDSNIPGFYRDPSTGRYYRITSDSHNQNYIETLRRKESEEYILHLNKKPRLLHHQRTRSCNTNIVKTISFHENGFIRNFNYNKEFLKFKTQQLSQTRELIFDASLCSFVRGEKDQIVSVWDDKVGEKSICEMTFKYKKKCSKPLLYDGSSLPSLKPHFHFCVVNERATHPPYSPCILDICSATYRNQNVFFYVDNNLLGPSCASVMAKTYNSRFMKKDFILKRTVWSCASNFCTGRFAVGSENCFYTIGKDFCLRTFSKHSCHVPGNVYSCEFNKAGTLLFCGLHTGYLVVSDMRTGTPVLKKDFGTGALRDTQLFDDEQSIVISGLANKLSLIDLRKNELVFNYDGHQTYTQKTPFTVNQDLNLICSTSKDNITRLWSLNSGELLHSIVPPNRTQRTYSLVLCNDAKWFVIIIQGHTLYTYEIP